MRPGAVLVGNNLGQTLLDNPYSMTSMTKGKAPGQAKKITKNQLKKFNKKMKALRVAKLSPNETKAERKQLRKALKKELKAGDKIYLNETIYAGAGSGTQILLLDQSTFTVGAVSYTHLTLPTNSRV